MVILGIDPGTRRIGYGVIKKSSAELKLLDAGLLAIKSKDDFGAMKEMKQQIDAVIKKFKPEALSIEKVYFVKNRKTGIKVAEARGIIISCALTLGLRVEEYGPNEVKAALTGYGFADKKAVLKMVRIILKEPGLKVIDDASDALALAIVAGYKYGVDSRATHL
ncbi:MAG: crossover junction endodeoxyribonuclease RuvC [Candidatus Liptonbacteria bacterium]|nr:crossover junction endodeoxyribonuclease RuvC [Candidatus Liptonbacteria bacterium]